MKAKETAMKMKSSIYLRVFPAILALSAMTACSGFSAGKVREQLGVNREAPDEFAVVRNAPLEVPPPYAVQNLPKPQRGAARPQENTPDEAARMTLLGKDPEQARAATAARNASTRTAADEVFMTKALANEADPTVRAVLDAETAKLHNRNKSVMERLFNYGGNAAVPSATVVDAQAESARIQENLKQGKSIADGEIPYKEE